MNSRELSPYLDELRERLLKTGPLKFMDGSEISPVEIFETNLKSLKRYTHLSDFPFDYTLANAFKHRYLQMSIMERAKKMREKGMPVLSSFRAFPDLIIGSGATLIGIVPCSNEVSLADNLALKEEGFRFTSFEACPMEPAIALWLRDGKLPVDLTVYADTLIGDLPCILNLLRRFPDIPLMHISIPYNGKGKPWALEYLAEQFRAFVQKLGEIRGSQVTDEELRNGFRMMNKMRRSYREYIDIVNSAETPPIARMEDGFVKVGIIEPGDPVAITCANEQLNEELRDRVKKGIIPPTMKERPLRIYISGLALVSPPAHSFIESQGGICLGPEFLDVDILCDDVDEKGDPYESYSRWWLEQWPWSYNLEERTEWLIKTLRRYNPDGVISTSIWGCALYPPYERYMADKIKEKLGIPTMVIAHDDIPDAEIGEDGRFRIKGDLRTRIEGFMEILHARRER